MRADFQSNLTMSIGELARLTDCKIETIRYYERIGLMANPPRSEGGHRVYSAPHLKRLTFIRRGRELGFPMDQVKALLAMVDANTQCCAEVASQAEQHLASIRQRIHDLQRLETTLSETLAKCDRGDEPDCPILDALQSSKRL